jgi:hypothetical protein
MIKKEVLKALRLSAARENAQSMIRDMQPEEDLEHVLVACFMNAVEYVEQIEAAAIHSDPASLYTAIVVNASSYRGQ